VHGRLEDNDPIAGGWYFYAWQTESGGSLPDYPKLVVWPDAIYMSANIFSTTGAGSFKNVQVWAFNRQEMEAGTTAHGVTFNLPRIVGGVTAFSLPAAEQRPLRHRSAALREAGPVRLDLGLVRDPSVEVPRRLDDRDQFDVHRPDERSHLGLRRGPAQRPGARRQQHRHAQLGLMMQNQYVNMNGVESLWLTHTVGNGGSPNVAQVRWYQLPVTGGTVASAPSQQSTYGPDSSNRFMPSLAVDQNGDMAIGYSASSSSSYASIRYAGRLVTDPANTLGQSETTLITGNGFQCCTFKDGTTNTRWGDYSALTIDPDGCTFWYTNEYYNSRATIKR
jgi:hypothetical protein